MPTGALFFLFKGVDFLSTSMIHSSYNKTKEVTKMLFLITLAVVAIGTPIGIFTVLVKSGM